MNKKFPIYFFLMRSIFLGFLFSKMYSLCGTDSIFAMIIGTGFSLILLYFITKIKSFNKIGKIFYFILSSLFIIIGITILESFVTSFFLINTPKIIIILPTIVLALYTASKSKDTIYRLSNIQIYISAILIVLIIIPLILNKAEITNLLPLFSHSIPNIIKAALFYTTITCSPLLLIYDDTVEYKTCVKYYIITTIINIIINIIILSVLKPSLITSYSFPEYIVLKSVKIGSFIENIENILASVWYFDIFSMMTLSIKKINTIINNKYLSFIFIIFITCFITFFIMNNYSYVLYIYHYGIYIMLLLVLIIISNGKYK